MSKHTAVIPISLIHNISDCLKRYRQYPIELDDDHEAANIIAHLTEAIPRPSAPAPSPSTDEGEFKQGMKHGIYYIYWKQGGKSIAAVGYDGKGNNWFAPLNWTVVPCFDWSMVERVEMIIRNNYSNGNNAIYIHATSTGEQDDRRKNFEDEVKNLVEVGFIGKGKKTKAANLKLRAAFEEFWKEQRGYAMSFTALKLPAPPPNQSGESDAVGFAEWAITNGWAFSLFSNMWHKQGQTLTGAELYQQYKKSQNG